MKRQDPRRTLTEIQSDYVDTFIAATSRWSHRKDGGHSHRTIGAAAKRFRKEMSAWGFNETFIRTALQDAKDVAVLEMRAA